MAASVAHDGSRQPAVSSHGPVPGSPTLTNPDMILPDYEMPDSPESRLQSPIMAWRDPNIDQLDFQLPLQNSYDPKYVSHATPIIYGNGTMLSDIGEVTEVESTVGPTSARTSSRYSGYAENETFGSNSAIITKGYQRRSKPSHRERRASIDSTSTLTKEDQRHFGDFDDSISIGDSSFQGDDEESMASSYVEGTATYALRPRNSNGERDDSYSTTYISNRAEQILANAKRRLTAMEGNLSRARSSLGNSDGSTPSPQLGRPGSVAREGSASQAGYHSRIKSEDVIRDFPKPASGHPQRSASALGAAGGYRQPSSKTKREDPSLPAGRPVYGITHHPIDTALEPLSEDDGQDVESNADSARQNNGLLSPTFGVYDKSLSRSSSVTQMRDIQDQMQGLRGKISTLKEQARADSMKRRSLQSLRTPSPFTHARWDGGLMEPRQIQSSMDIRDESHLHHSASEEDGRDTPLASGHAAQGTDYVSEEEKSSSNGNEKHGELERPATPVTPDYEHQEGSPDQDSPKSQMEDDVRTENGDAEPSDYEEDFNDAQAEINDWESESGESLYHDTQQHQLSHEDREDAFDYEHFFLHSALGSMSRRKRRGSSGSSSSESSVETTRGPESRMSYKRRSVGSTGSDETFATATEGRASRSSAFKSALSRYDDVGYEELPSLQEVNSNDSADEGQEQGTRQRTNSVLYRPSSIAQHANRLHRPSVSSFESTGTNRSFPLINKARLNGGVLTPGGSPDLNKQMSETPNGSLPPGPSAAAMQGLPRDDQIAIERLVASLGQCVLGLGETSRAGSESREFRRRIDAARRILEGHDAS